MVFYNGSCQRRGNTCKNGKGYLGQRAGNTGWGVCIDFPPGQERGPQTASKNDKQKPTYNPGTKCQNCLPCKDGDWWCGVNKWWCDVNKQSCESQAVAGQQAGQIGAALDPLAKYMPVFIIMGAGVAGIFLLQKIL